MEDIYLCIIQVTDNQGFIQTPQVWGELQTLGGSRGSGGCAPSGVQGQSPWSEGLGGEAPQKLKAFRCISSKFLHFLGDIVEIQHLGLDVMFTLHSYS